MTNKIILLFALISLFSCRADRNEVSIDFDTKIISLKSGSYYIDRIRISNNLGKVLYNVKLKEDELGESQMALFQNYPNYVYTGSLEIIKSDTIKKFISIRTISIDHTSIETYDGSFEKSGERVLKVKGRP